MQRSKASQSFLSILVLACAAVFALSARRPEDPPAPAAPPRPTTIVLVRHAEKDAAGDARDPGLSTEGKARAERLARMFAAAGVTHLFATEFHRTQDT
ncbi:MAG TPA: histidine phosphatase family protein, partial [Planctomycetota bacterium]|nr:histidine phosphatase family protein [Planctomycetota bacterium]